MKLFSNKIVVILFLLSGGFLVSFVNFSSNNFAPKPLQKRNGDTLKYIFMGHTYSWGSYGRRVDPRIIEIDKARYDRLWLGGDVCSESMLYKSTIEHIDSVFNLGSPKTQWAMGNHDVRNGNIQWYHELSGKQTYNYYSENGAVSVCLNSQLNPSMCEDLNLQFKMLKNICDTISVSKHLFVFHHANIWKNIPGLPTPGSYSHTNFERWQANCDSANTYYHIIIYPMLKEVRNRGINVYCILGDSGDGSKKGFHQETTDSIHFFASGINNSKYFDDPIALAQQPKDSVLIFEHVPNTQYMSWKFHDLDSLINAQ